MEANMDPGPPPNGKKSAGTSKKLNLQVKLQRKTNRMLILLRSIAILVILTHLLVGADAATGRQSRRDCGEHQIFSRDTCVDCSSIIYGCRQCEEVDRVVQEFSESRISSFIQCKTCDYGMYKLEFNDQEPDDPADTSYRLNMCVQRCEDFAHNYVSNPNNMKCEFCGPNCARCTLQFGCTECFGKRGRQVSSARGEYPDEEFPYSSSRPSSQFQVCYDCDERCDDCTDYRKEVTNVTLVEIPAADASSTGDDPALEEPAPQYEEVYETFGMCKSCPEYVQAEDIQADNRMNDTYQGFCKLIDDHDISNCVQADPSDTGTCIQCRQNYQATGSSCSACSSAATKQGGCARCASSSCQECMHGWAWDGSRCSACALSDVNEATNALMIDRCGQCEEDDLEQCKYCEVGWRGSRQDAVLSFVTSSSSDVCKLRCADSQYPTVADSGYKTALPGRDAYTLGTDARRCASCHSSCKKCTGSGRSDACTECEDGEYLEILDQKAQSGECVSTITNEEIESFDIYVTNEQESWDPVIYDQINGDEQRDGTYERPLKNIVDAFTRAKELVASYKDDIEVRVHLFAGEHYVLENRFDGFNIYYEKTAKAAISRNLKLTIQAMTCADEEAQYSTTTPHCNENGEKVVIYNKIRERFMIEVFAKVTLKDIVIDSLDSILPLQSPCLSEYRQCCVIEGTSVDDAGVTDSPDGESSDCAEHFADLKLNDKCQVNQPNTMFKFVNYHDEDSQSDSQELELRDSEIRNVFYAMNSLVNITQQGAKVNITGTKITQINICGAIINNMYSPNNNIDLTAISDDYLSEKEKEYLEFQNEFQNAFLEWNEERLNPDGNAILESANNEITLQSSEFSYLNFASEKIDEIPYVSADNGVQYQGLVLNLIDFGGKIEVDDCTFSNNLFRFDSCELMEERYKQYFIQGEAGSGTEEESDADDSQFEDDFGKIHRYRDSKFDKIQIKAIVNIINHKHEMVLARSVFENNTGTKGIINIERGYGSEASFLIYGNTFTGNSALVDANVLNLRTVTDRRWYTRRAYPTDCGGLLIQDNAFEQNIGCKFTQGAINLYCLNSDKDSSEDLVKYIDELDSQYFVGRDFDEALLEDTPDSASGSTTTDYNVNNEMFVAHSNRLVLQGNRYEGNYAGTRRSVVQVEGFPAVWSVDEEYAGNYNWFEKAFYSYSPLKDFIEEPSEIQSVFTEADLINYQYKSQAMLTIKKPIYVNMSGSAFVGNWIVDDFDESIIVVEGELPGEAAASDSTLILQPNEQAQGLLIMDHAGRLTIERGTAFSGYAGYEGLEADSVVSVDDTYYKQGFKTRLMQWSNCHFKEFGITGLAFRSNVGYQHPDESLQAIFKPRLLTFEKADQNNFTIDGDEITLEGVEASGNVFTNTECMVDLVEFGFKLRGWVLSENGARDIDEDLNTAIIQLDLERSPILEVENMRAEGNNVGKGQFFKFLNADDEHLPIVSMNFSGSQFEDNTSKLDAALFVLPRLPGLELIFHNTSLINNYGNVTNDFYLPEMASLTLAGCTWGQRRQTWSPPGPPPSSLINEAKFLLFNDTEYPVQIDGSTFDCGYDIDEDTIFTLNNGLETGDSSVFKLTLPAAVDETACSRTIGRRDLTREEREAAEAAEEALASAPAAFAGAGGDGGQAAGGALTSDPESYGTADAGLDRATLMYLEEANITLTYLEEKALQTCRSAQLKLQFSNTVFKGCHQAHKGAIFQLTNEAKVSIKGPGPVAGSNSALYGGFAYLEGLGAELWIMGGATLEGQSAYYGGAFYLTEEASLHLLGSSEEERVNIANGTVYQGMINLEKQSIINLKWASFEGNHALFRAMVFSRTNSLIDLQLTNFTGNSGVDDAVLIYIDGDHQPMRLQETYDDGGLDHLLTPTYNRGHLLKQVAIVGNKMDYGGNMIKLVNAQMEASILAVRDNEVFHHHGGIHVAYSHLKITLSTMTSWVRDDSFFTDPVNTDIGDNLEGAYLYVGADSNVESRHNVYAKSRASVGGCVALEASSSASFQDDAFTNCVATQGGAIFGSDFNELSIERSSFESNMAFSGQGGSIFARRFHGTLTIDDTHFEGESNQVYLDQGYDVNINGLDLTWATDGWTTPPSSPPPRLSGGFYIKNMKKISRFNDVEMVGLRGWDGGCLYVGLDDGLRALNFNQEEYRFTKLKLESCMADDEAGNGGGIFIENIRTMSIGEGSTIKGCRAVGGDGGGVYFTCENPERDCELDLAEVRMSENQALNGGGISWPHKEPRIPSFEGTFDSNIAEQYGPQQASFPVRMVRFLDLGIVENVPRTDRQPYHNSSWFYELALDTEAAAEANDGRWKFLDPIATYESHDEDGSDYVIDGVSSGANIPAQYLGLLDHRDQIVRSNTGSQVDISITSEATQVVGTKKFFSKYGVYEVAYMRIFSQPGSSVGMVATAAEDAILNHDNLDEPYTMTFFIQTQKCLKGQAQRKADTSDNLICDTCPRNTYLLEAPGDGEIVECELCDNEKAECSGSSEIGPKAGYWREHEGSDVFFACYNADACKGLYLDGDTLWYSPLGWCEEGYYGALCSACVPGYYRSPSYQCEQCRSATELGLTITLWMVVFTVGIGVLVKATIGSQTQSQTHSVFLKILLNHIQMIVVTSMFDIGWPPEVEEFFKSLTFLIEAQRAMIRFDCLLDRRSFAGFELLGEEYNRTVPAEGELRMTYMKLFMYAGMPLACCFLSYFAWRCMDAVQHRLSRTKASPGASARGKGAGGDTGGDLYSKFLATLIIMIFLVHPQITQYMLFMFNCEQWDEEHGWNRLVYDPQIVCFEDYHETFAVALALPCLIIWGLGIPAMIYILLSKDRQYLDTDEVKIKFGFLYTGYKRDNYYWEIIIMYRKILCLFVFVIMSAIEDDPNRQALILLILIWAFTVANNMQRPFINRALNDVEDLSLTIQVVTIYCGIFFNSAGGQQARITPEEAAQEKQNKDFIFLCFIVVTNIIFLISWAIKCGAACKGYLRSSRSRYYVWIFLCCRKDKLEKEELMVKREEKRELIIQKIEEISFYIKKMKSIYEKQIFYEGHDLFLKLLYFIENEKKHIDLTVKTHNMYIQGKIARERKFDPQRMKEVAKNFHLSVDAEEGGGALEMPGVMKYVRTSPRALASPGPKGYEPGPDQREARGKGAIFLQREDLGPDGKSQTDGEQSREDGDLNLLDQNDTQNTFKHISKWIGEGKDVTSGAGGTSPDQREAKSGPRTPDASLLRKATRKITATNALGKGLGTPGPHAPPAGQPDAAADPKFSFQDTAKSSMSLLEKASAQPRDVVDPQAVELREKEEPKGRGEAEKSAGKEQGAKTGLESDNSADERARNARGKAGGTTKLKTQNMGSIWDIVEKSRNEQSRVKIAHKSRIFAEDLKQRSRARKYMLELFTGFEEKHGEETASPDASPIKEEVGEKEEKDKLSSGRMAAHPIEVTSWAPAQGQEPRTPRGDQTAEDDFVQLPSPRSDRGSSKKSSRRSRRGSGARAWGADELLQSGEKQAEAGIKQDQTLSDGEKADDDDSPSKGPRIVESEDTRQEVDQNKRLRPKRNVQYRMQFGMFDQKPKDGKDEEQESTFGTRVEYLLPQRKKKKYTLRVNDETGEEIKETLSGSSDKLDLDLVDASGQVRGYNQDKEMKVILDTEREGREKTDNTLSAPSDKIIYPDRSVKESDDRGKSIYTHGANMNYPERFKDSPEQSKSVFTMGANMQAHSLNPTSNQDDTKQISQDGAVMDHRIIQGDNSVFASVTSEMQNKDIISINSGNRAQMEPQTARDDEQGLLVAKHERKLGRAPKKSKKRKTYEEYLQEEKDNSVFRQIVAERKRMEQN